MSERVSAARARAPPAQRVQRGLRSLTSGLARGSLTDRLRNTPGCLAVAASSDRRFSAAPEPAPKGKPLPGYLRQSGFVEAVLSSRGSTASRQASNRRPEEHNSRLHATQRRVLGRKSGSTQTHPAPTSSTVRLAPRSALQPEVEVTHFRGGALAAPIGALALRFQALLGYLFRLRIQPWQQGLSTAESPSPSSLEGSARDSTPGCRCLSSQLCEARASRSSLCRVRAAGGA